VLLRMTFQAKLEKLAGLSAVPCGRPRQQRPSCITWFARDSICMLSAVCFWPWTLYDALEHWKQDQWALLHGSRTNGHSCMHITIATIHEWIILPKY